MENNRKNNENKAKTPKNKYQELDFIKESKIREDKIKMSKKIYIYKKILNWRQTKNGRTVDMKAKTLKVIKSKKRKNNLKKKKREQFNKKRETF